MDDRRHTDWCAGPRTVATTERTVIGGVVVDLGPRYSEYSARCLSPTKLARPNIPIFQKGCLSPLQTTVGAISDWPRRGAYHRPNLPCHARPIDGKGMVSLCGRGNRPAAIRGPYSARPSYPVRRRAGCPGALMLPMYNKNTTDPPPRGRRPTRDVTVAVITEEILARDGSKQPAGPGQTERCCGCRTPEEQRKGACRGRNLCNHLVVTRPSVAEASAPGERPEGCFAWKGGCGMIEIRYPGDAAGRRAAWHPARAPRGAL